MRSGEGHERQQGFDRARAGRCCSGPPPPRKTGRIYAWSSAVEHRDARAVQALLKQRVDVNAAQPDGATALHWAAHWDDVATAELLLRAGAKVNAANDHGVTPLALACENGSVADGRGAARGGRESQREAASPERRR